ncbi:L-lysine 6-transaminase [Mesoterricola sediminis]|uniref:L-lysine-epsilon aminotransferase n=1 Tax=Mesoterricola sediminis TaxID=2927980 RepID=A0AA48GW67_9BACT|nr:L-lysine 6-transaminase [Mesoterricola sediminis]
MKKSQEIRVQPTDVFDVLGRHLLVDGFHMVMDLDKSKGSWIVDARDGKRYLDFYTFFATAPLGHNHPRLQEAAFQAELGAIAVNKPANSDIYTTAYAEWVETFATKAAPAYLPHLFWIDGGALAVENALKAAFDWKVRKNLEKGRPEKGSKVIHFKEAFHGRSGYTLSLTNTADPRKYQYFPKFDWPRIPNPKVTFPLDAENTARVEQMEKVALAQIEAVVRQDPDEIACLIIEPIQGEGGDNHFRTEFLRELRRLADEHEFLLIFDEVQTGFGATGKWWAHQHHDVRPDIIAFGKKTQCCGIAAGARLDEVDSVFKIPSRINSTWGGNLVDMVRGKRIIDVMVEEDLVGHCARQGERLLKGLEQIHRDFPEFTSNPRGRGLFCALDMCTPALRTATVSKAQDLGMIILSTGQQGLRFRPALNLATEDLDLGVELLHRSIQLAAESVRPHMAKA